MKVGLCHIVVIYYGTSFKGTFVTICKVLDLSNETLAKHHHNELIVDYLPYFLNKVIIIEIEYRQSTDVFIPTWTATGYT